MERLIEGFDYRTFKEIAKRCDSLQLRRDVEYAKFSHYHNPYRIIAKRYPDGRGFYVASMNNGYFYLFGLGVAKEHQGKGYARKLLEGAVATADALGYAVIRCKTDAGVPLYQHVLGATIVGEAPRGGG